MRYNNCQKSFHFLESLCTNTPLYLNLFQGQVWRSKVLFLNENILDFSEQCRLQNCMQIQKFLIIHKVYIPIYEVYQGDITYRIFLALVLHNCSSTNKFSSKETVKNLFFNVSKIGRILNNLSFLGPSIESIIITMQRLSNFFKFVDSHSVFYYQSISLYRIQVIFKICYIYNTYKIKHTNKLIQKKLHQK